MKKNRTVREVLVEALAFEAAPGEGTDPALLSPQARAVLVIAVEQVTDLIGPDNGDDLSQIDSVSTLEARLGIEEEPEYKPLEWTWDYVSETSGAKGYGAMLYTIADEKVGRKDFLLQQNGASVARAERIQWVKEEAEQRNRHRFGGEEGFWRWNNG